MNTLYSVRSLICPRGFRIASAFGDFEVINVAPHGSVKKALKTLIIVL